MSEQLFEIGLGCLILGFTFGAWLTSRGQS